MSAFFATLRAWFSAMFATPKRAAGTASTAAVLAATALFVGPWEGERTEAYLDRIASPPVWTVCYGEPCGLIQHLLKVFTIPSKIPFLLDGLYQLSSPPKIFEAAHPLHTAHHAYFVDPHSVGEHSANL